MTASVFYRGMALRVTALAGSVGAGFLVGFGRYQAGAIAWNAVAAILWLTLALESRSATVEAGAAGARE